MAENYSPPVSNLLTLGMAMIHDESTELYKGFAREDIPALIRMVEDRELQYWKPNKDGAPAAEAYAQVHAWRILTLLNAVEAIPAFLGLLDSVDDDDDDFIGEEIPLMLGRLGAPAIDPCRDYLADRKRGIYARVAAADALRQIGIRHPETRDACVQALMSTLDDYQSDDETVNAFTLSYLADLGAVEAAPLAKKIYEEGHADLEVAGNYEEYQLRVGLLEESLTPSKFGSVPDWLMRQMSNDISAAKKQIRQVEKKEKNKRKQEKKARKRHRKK